MLREGPMVDAHRVTLSDEDDFAGWRGAARGLAEARVPPAAIRWEVSGGEADLFAAAPDTLPPPDGAARGDAAHGQAARPAGEQAAEQVIVAGVVAEGEGRVAG